ncbi:MAG: hypothetical protein J6V14_00710 [Clostridia bacterium]|nr:hypothetical protein [Clostridia bacterium]
MEIELKLTKSNGQSQSVIRDISRLSDAYMLGGVVFDIRETAVDGEYVIYFQPQSDVTLKQFELVFEFDPAGALIFDAGICTNAWAGYCPRTIRCDFPGTFSWRRGPNAKIRTRCFS